MPPVPPDDVRKILLEAEAILQFIKNNEVANDQNADIVIESLVAAASDKISKALENLPY